jgi:hypothetical protein
LIYSLEGKNGTKGLAEGLVFGSGDVINGGSLDEPKDGIRLGSTTMQEHMAQLTLQSEATFFHNTVPDDPAEMIEFHLHQQGESWVALQLQRELLAMLTRRHAESGGMHPETSHVT